MRLNVTRCCTRREAWIPNYPQGPRELVLHTFSAMCTTIKWGISVWCFPSHLVRVFKVPFFMPLYRSFCVYVQCGRNLKHLVVCLTAARREWSRRQWSVFFRINKDGVLRPNRCSSLSPSCFLTVVHCEATVGWNSRLGTLRVRNTKLRSRELQYFQRQLHLAYSFSRVVSETKRHLASSSASRSRSWIKSCTGV